MQVDAASTVPATRQAAIVAPRWSATATSSCCRVYRGAAARRRGDHPARPHRGAGRARPDLRTASTTCSARSGRNGANKDGALSRLLADSADNLDGQGQNLHDTIHDLGLAAADPVRRPRRPVRHREQPAGLHDDAGRRTTSRCATSTPTSPTCPRSSAGERGDLAAALENLATRSATCPSFVQDNRAEIIRSDQGLQRHRPATLVKEQRRAGRDPRRRPGRAVEPARTPTTRAAGTLDTRIQHGRSCWTPRCCSARCSTPAPADRLLGPAEPVRDAAAARPAGQSAHRRADRHRWTRRSAASSGASNDRAPATTARRPPSARHRRSRLGLPLRLAAPAALAPRRLPVQRPGQPPAARRPGQTSDVYQVTVEFADVLDLVPQSAVKVNDVTVGAVESIGLVGWHAEVHLRVLNSRAPARQRRRAS